MRSDSVHLLLLVFFLSNQPIHVSSDPKFSELPKQMFPIYGNIRAELKSFYEIRTKGMIN